MRLINSKPYPHVSRLLSKAEDVLDYMRDIQRYSTAFVSKDLVREICTYWSRMNSVSRYARYDDLEPQLGSLTIELSGAHDHFSSKWPDVDAVFDEFVNTLHIPPDVEHNLKARDRALALELFKLYHFLEEKGLRRYVQEFRHRLANKQEEGDHP